MSSTTNPEGMVSLGNGMYIKFVALGNGIYIKKSSAEAHVSSLAPSIILIFGWMSAAMPHLMKYAKAYEDLYPSAIQILVRSEPSDFWGSESTLRANTTPLVEALQAMGCLEAEKPGENTEEEKSPLRILTHCFSNGGAYSLSNFHRAITSQQLVVRRQVVSALVLDSLPGRGRFEDSKQAFAVAFKNPIVYFCISAFMFALYAIAWIRGHLVDGVPLSFILMGQDLHSENLVGWMSKRTPRLYLYSEKDELIPPDTVREHAAEAVAKGFTVNLEIFAESKHVSHARMYPERYWGEVKAVWDRAVASAA